MAISEFPNLADDGYRQTSPPTPCYNCIAWAAGDATQWWEPFPGYFWPTSPVPQEGTVENLLKAFAAIGYAKCEGVALEAGFDKIAIYAAHGEYLHAARQLDSGKWTSKLGPEEDIEHDVLHGLEGGEYGQVVCIMKRPKK